MENNLEVPSATRGSGETGPNWREGESLLTGSEAKRERIAIYIEWLLTPEAEREPKTKTALASLLGVTSETLRRYDSEPTVQRQVAERARAVAKVAMLPDVLNHLYAIATGNIGAHGDKVSPGAAVSASKALLDWFEKTSAIREDQVVGLEDLTEEELIAHALSVLQNAATNPSQ